MDSERVEQAWRDDRRRLMDLAYRMLGSIRDAEDVVAEAYARFAVADNEVDDPRGWLITVTSRLCLDRMRSAETTRRAYVGPWLPEPIVDSSRHRPGPEDRVTLDESVRMALLVVLEQLSPGERTSFVLHDVFRLEFAEIAALVGRSPDACRQLAVRARRRIAADDPSRFSADPDEQREVARRFALACSSGDFDLLVSILDPDVVGDFDSGGYVADAPLQPVRGARADAGQLHRSFAAAGCTFEVADINGEAGVVVLRAGRVMAVIAVGVVAGRVDHIHGVGNPNKLAEVRWTTQARIAPAPSGPLRRDRSV